MINRPQPNEYPPYASGYVGLVGNDPILDILEHQKEITYNFLIRMGEAKGDFSYEPGKWTVKQVVGHMIDAERTFAYRALCFSREAIELPGFDQDLYIEKANFNARSLEDLANELKTTRSSNLYLFKSFSEEQLLQKGIASNNPVSVRGILYIAAGHEMHHIKILRERYL